MKTRDAGPEQMAEGNGSGRLDHIEALLDKLAERQGAFSIIQERDHEESQRDYKQLMTWQVLMQEKMDRWTEDRNRYAEERKHIEARLDALSAKTDERIAALVSAIGKLIERLPAPTPS